MVFTSAITRPANLACALCMKASAVVLQESTGTILHLTIANPIHPVDCDILHHIFSQYGGNILRIVCFEKNGSHQALVEYSDPNGAAVARQVCYNSIYASQLPTRPLL